ncbi:hypothetical protein CNEONATNEC26_01110 [Clostridium neonatale]|nr:hypothetical protein CNEONATNEC26_01110 [Clostridium neonatale]
MLYEFENSIYIIKIVAIKAPNFIGILKSIFKAIATPKISAIAVPIAASIAVDVIILPMVGLIYSLIASEIHKPVTIPKCAALCCNTINIIVDSVIIHNSLYP